jgi:hypothetical protein
LNQKITHNGKEVLEMNRLKKGNILWAMVTTLILLFSAQLMAGEKKESQSTSAEDVKKETAEAMKAIKNYSYDQRDKAVKEMKAAMDNLDSRIDLMQSRMEKNWNAMSQASREKASETLKTLRKKRNDLSEWYGGLKHSSAKAWNHVKDGFASGYKSLADAFDKAQDEFASK